VYEYLIKKMKYKKKDLRNAILLHGGGWKKLENLKITNSLFKNKLNLKLNLKNIYNYYGMIEQTGSIFTECKNGYFHTTIFSDIFIRDQNFEKQNFNKRGLIQLISLIPTSYPGHNILTEDIGEIKGEDTCNCGKSGKYFLVHGRAKKAEIRGCSDVR
jgi:phenylacetate-coenzyme A ligase PaaK-like adenylate-forming protein